MQVDDEMLMAFVDGELDEIAGARIERQAAEDPELRRRIEIQRRLRSRIAAHYAPVAEEPVPDRFSALLKSEVIDLASARPRRRLAGWQNLGAIAASLVVGLFAGQWLQLGGSGPVTAGQGGLIAQGGLAQALDTQLASEPTAGAQARVGISFASTDGRMCRTFESADLTGLACRDDGRWRLVVTAPGNAAGQGEYRQAGSGSLIVMQAAQEMMSGDPLDAAADRRLRDSGWRKVPAGD